MGMEIPIEAVQRQIASGIDIIIHLGRMRDKTRKVLEIIEITGYEKGEIQMNTLYEFQEKGSSYGKVRGSLVKKEELQKRKNCWRQDIRKGEYFLGGIEAAGAAGLTALLFYRSIAVSPILLLPVGGMFLYVWEKEILRKKEREFTRQFLDTLQSVSAALNVGYSLENAMLEAEKEMRIMYREQDRIVREWKYMIRQMKMNLSMERILEEFSWRVDQEDVRNFVTVIAAVKKSGETWQK